MTALLIRFGAPPAAFLGTVLYLLLLPFVRCSILVRETWAAQGKHDQQEALRKLQGIADELPRKIAAANLLRETKGRAS